MRAPIHQPVASRMSLRPAAAPSRLGLSTAEYTATTATRRAPAETRARCVRSPELTPRELEVLDLLIDSVMTNDEIGRALGISVETVKRHLSTIMDKTGFGTRLELAVRMLEKRYQSQDDPVRTELRAKIGELETLNASLQARLDVAERVLAHQRRRESASRKL